MNIQAEDTSRLSMSTQVENLEVSITELIALCKKLAEENRSYKNSNKELMLERSELQLKNDKVRGQVEAMVNRLKLMDKAS